MAAIAAMIAAGVIGAGSSYLGAKSQSDSVKKNQQFNDAQFQNGRNFLGQGFYGNQLWGQMNNPTPYQPPTQPTREQFMKGGNGHIITDANGYQHVDQGVFDEAGYNAAMKKYQQDLAAYGTSYQDSEAKRQAAINAGTGGPLLGQLRGLADQAQQGGQQNLNNAMAGFGALNQRGDARLQNVAGLYNYGQQQLGNFYSGAEGSARQFGRGREQIIRSDSADRLKGLNQQTDASLAGLGVNSLGANQKAQNTASIGREQDRALTDLNDAQTQLLMRAQMGRAGAQGQLLGQGISAQDEIMGQNLARQYNQQGVVNAMRGQNLERNLSYQGAPVQTQLGLMQSSIFNPYLQNPQQYIPTANPWAAAGGSASNTLGMLGGYGMANGGFSGNAVRPQQQGVNNGLNYLGGGDQSWRY